MILTYVICIFYWLLCVLSFPVVRIFCRSILMQYTSSLSYGLNDYYDLTHALLELSCYRKSFFKNFFITSLQFSSHVLHMARMSGVVANTPFLVIMLLLLLLLSYCRRHWLFLDTNFIVYSFTVELFGAYSQPLTSFSLLKPNVPKTSNFFLDVPQSLHEKICRYTPRCRMMSIFDVVCFETYKMTKRNTNTTCSSGSCSISQPLGEA